MAAIQQLISSYNSAIVYDTDAQSYFTILESDVTLTTDQKGYINTWILAGKTNGWWTTKQVLYLPIWSNASANKWNLKDLRDLDAAYRLTFNSATHTSSGVHGNGSAYAANTYFSPNDWTSYDSSSLGFWSTVSGTDGVDIGTQPSFVFQVVASYGGTAYGDSTNNNRITSSVANSIGLYETTRTNSTLVTFYKNGASLGTNLNSRDTGQTTSLSFMIGDANYPSYSLGNLPTSRTYSMIFIGAGENSTIAANFYSDTQTLMTALGL